MHKQNVTKLGSIIGHRIYLNVVLLLRVPPFCLNSRWLKNCNNNIFKTQLLLPVHLWNKARECNPSQRYGVDFDLLNAKPIVIFVRRVSFGATVTFIV